MAVFLQSSILLEEPMPQHIAGVFVTTEEVLEAVQRLRATGVPEGRVSVVFPGEPPEAISKVPSMSAEQPGLARGFGGLLGGVLGAAGALTILLPVIGSVTVAGALAALAAAGGVAGGAAAGSVVERFFSEGIPADEIYVYEDALRKGRSLVVVSVEDDDAAEVRRILEGSGAESIDAARENFWVGLRDAEKLHYGANFDRDETSYRRGFEAALAPEIRGKSFEQARVHLRRDWPAGVGAPAFRRGFERGQIWHEGAMHDRGLPIC